MAQSNESLGILDLMRHPGFCVQENVVVRVNPAAENRHIHVGMPIQKLLETGKKEYGNYTGGCLYLALNVHGKPCHAAVNRIGDMDVFLLDQEDQESLQAMALAARELRDPLTSIMSTADSLFPTVAADTDPKVREYLARMNRGLYQMLRIIGNMSDAERYATENFAKMEVIDFTALIAEVLESVRTLLAQSGITLEIQNLKKPVLGMGDRDMLERAILNLISNATKYASKGSAIQAVLTKHGKSLCLTLENQGDSIPEALRSNVFHRYQRQTGMEDPRNGIGLGMVLVRNTAIQHGGTVLVSCPEEGGTRIAMTLAIRDNPSPVVRTPRLRIDYAGELDHGLIELAEILPAELYEIP